MEKRKLLQGFCKGVKKMQRREFIKNAAVLGVATFGGSSLLAENVAASSVSAEKMSAEKASATAENKVTTITLNDGNTMPIIGFGTWLIRGAECQKAVESALSVGYRHIDTAQMYGNEAEVGNAVVASGIPRSELFITTKLSSNMTFDEAARAIDAALTRLKVDYVDLMLIHKAYARHLDMYRAMEAAQKAGKIKSLGLSNFTPELFSGFLKNCKVVPAANQMETHVFNQQRALRKLMQPAGTKLCAWSPFAKGAKELLDNAVLRKIAQKHGKTSAQVALRFLIEEEIVVLPKTTHIARMRENIAVFDFALDSEDKKALYALDRGTDMYRWFDSKITDFFLEFFRS